MSELGLDSSTCITSPCPHNGPIEGVDILQLRYKIILKLDMIKNNIQVKVCKLIMNRVFKKDFFFLLFICEFIFRKPQKLEKLNFCMFYI